MPIKKGGVYITSLNQWERLAPPKARHHWVDGRSAKEVARAWLYDQGESLPPEVHAVLTNHPCFGPVIAWEAEPEAKLRFDEFAGEPRNSDLAITVHDATGPYILAVEAKADETYGETVAATVAAALERRLENPRSNGVARILRLTSLLLRPRAEHEVKVTDLRYQLFTSCAGAVAEAERRHMARAVMLVHEFITPATSDAKHERNTADLARFLGRVSGHALTSIADGALYGPFVAQGVPNVQLFIGKVQRNLRKTDADFGVQPLGDH